MIKTIFAIAIIVIAGMFAAMYFIDGKMPQDYIASEDDQAINQDVDGDVAEDIEDTQNRLEDSYYTMLILDYKHNDISTGAQTLTGDFIYLSYWEGDERAWKAYDYDPGNPDTKPEQLDQWMSGKINTAGDIYEVVVNYWP